MTPNLSDIATHEVSILQIALYALIFGARLAAFGVHSSIFHRQTLGATNEVLRVGSDLSLMALGVFVGASRSENSLFYRTIVSSNGSIPVWLIIGFAGFVVVFFVTYLLYLFLFGKQLREVVRRLTFTAIYAFSLLIGVFALGVAGVLAAPTTATK